MDFQKLIELLDSQYIWPDHYMFKFISKAEHREQLIFLVGNIPSEERPSSNGKYTSYTFHVLITKTSEVIEIYEKVSTISGIISL